MSYLIAVSGKGGVGKTTVSALIVNRLIAQRRVPVLAVDADPNTCLDRALGVSAGNTIGRVREEAKKAISGAEQTSGISKQELFQLKVADSLVEAEDFDLIAMGRPEGPGCYCYANNVLKSTITALSSRYPYVVLDNEAGLENLSRRIVQKVDLLIIVTDPSENGFRTVERLHQLAAEMGIQCRRLAVVVNRLRSEAAAERLAHLQQATHADFVLGLPDDAELADFGEGGTSLLQLSSSNPVLARVDEFLAKAILEKPVE